MYVQPYFSYQKRRSRYDFKIMFTLKLALMPRFTVLIIDKAKRIYSMRIYTKECSTTVLFIFMSIS